MLHRHSREKIRIHRHANIRYGIWPELALIEQIGSLLTRARFVLGCSSPSSVVY